MPNPGQMNRKMTVGKGKPKLDAKVIGRLLKLLFRDYPGKLACVFICIIVNAVVGVMPAVYIETITKYIVQGLEIGKTAGFAAAWDQTFPQVFREAIPGTTKIIIAQRISSVQDADMIVVMDDGQINTVGDHETLLATNAIYQEVYYSQNKAGDDNA